MIEYIPIIGLLLPKIQEIINNKIGEKNIKILGLKFEPSELRVFTSYILAFLIALGTVLFSQPISLEQFFGNFIIYMSEAYALSQVAYYTYFKKPPKGLED